MSHASPGHPADPEHHDAPLSPDNLAQLLNATSDAIVFLDRNYRFTFLNRQARAVISAAGEVLGRNLFESFPATVYPDSPYVEAYRRSMDQGETGEFEAFYPEPLNRWFRVQSYPSSNGIIIFFRDFTEEKAARDALHEKSKEAQRQLSEIETVYRTAPIGLALFDTRDFRYLRLNDRQAQFFGLPLEDILGRKMTDLAPIDGLRELFEQVLNGQPVINHLLEGELITHPGEHRYWTVSYFPVYSPDGSIQAISAATLEITQQKKAEQALIQSEKLAAVGRLASSIAHEINNPLESVTNLLFLARMSDNVAEIQTYLDTAERELRRVTVISSQTLRFHKQASSPQAVVLGDLIESTLSIFQGRLVNAHVLVESRFRAGTPIRCFEGELRQVISNLVSNAIDALPSSGGCLLLRTRSATRWGTGEQGVVLTVADNGAGMSLQTLKRLFEAFFTTKGIGGTGLGLWVTSEIIARHKGRLSVRSSQRPGRSGTVFSVFLPFTAAIR